MAIEADAFYAMLGIAMRAGALTLGESGVLKAIASGKAAFVLLDGGASERTRKMFADSCEHYGVRLMVTAQERLGQAIGKPGRMSAAVAKGTLAGKLLSLAGEE
ncbi:MAG: ribosomal L7Ae/L30e/S12e/Gadd45 family protein [Clostridia bacterium]|nr:ribosomal L7Ae/L30e/S12e/Gadd45 family protein [Clostridia bacterium]